MKPIECKAARALLDISQPDLAKGAKVGISSVVAFETQRLHLSARTVAKLQAELQRLGVEFVTTKIATGVKLNSPTRKRTRIGIEPAQIRAARALLNWNQQELGDASGLHFETIKRLERPSGSRILVDTLERLVHALDRANIQLIDGPGVLLVRNLRKAE